jgi:sirohydrochlorin cobaltochelatase
MSPIMSIRCGLILFAHGARDPRWARPFEDVAERVRRARPEALVRLAFLEMMSPGLPEAGAELAAHCDTVQVVPLFLGTGGHLRKDLPRLIEALQAAHPGTRFVLNTAVGEDERVIDAMAQAALASMAQDRPEPVSPGTGA